jgi:hypothetical protein
VARALARGTSWSILEPRRVQLRGRARNPDRKEDSLDRGSNKAEREAAFQKLQSERVAKNLEEDRERDAEERQERKQIRQEEREEREQVRQEEREKARGQEESST